MTELISLIEKVAITMEIIKINNVIEKIMGNYNRVEGDDEI